MIKIFFTNPVYLWYLLSIPILIISHFIFLKNAKFKAIRFANFETIQRITGYGKGKIITRNWAVLFIRLMILFSLILAISSPIIWYTGISNEKDFVIAIDASASMLAQDFVPNRLEAAKEYAIDFIYSIQGNARVGLIDFAGAAFIDQVMTEDRSLIVEEIKEIEVITLGGTDISGTIITGTNMLVDSEKGKTIILISDGSNTVNSYNEKAIDVAIEYARNNNVIVNTLGIGSNDSKIGYLPEYYNLTAIYNVEQLEHIANMTEGKFYDSNNPTDLMMAFNDIANNTQKSYISKDLKPLLLLLGLLLLFFEWGIINTRYKRLP